MTAVTVDVVVQKYIQIRDEIARIEGEVKEQVNAMKDKQQKLEAWLRVKAEQDGVESFKTPHGTAYFTTVDYAQVADWTALLEYILRTESFDLFEKRVAKTAVRAIINETKEVPPGVNYGIRKEMGVRKPTAK